MPGPALSLFSSHHAKAFALAARRSTGLHGAWVCPPTTEAEAAALAQRRQGPDDFAYLVRDHDTADIAGFIEVTHIVRGYFQSGCLGYYMFSGYQGRGYMKWALQAVVKRAWADLKLHRLEASVHADNLASLGLLRTLGFQPDGGPLQGHQRWVRLAP